MGHSTLIRPIPQSGAQAEKSIGYGEAPDAPDFAPADPGGPFAGPLVPSIVSWKVIAAAVNKKPTRGAPDPRASLPAGLTYLAQLLAHDVANHQRRYAMRPHKQPENRRRSPLMLETLYGEGLEPFGAQYATSNASYKEVAGFFDLGPMRSLTEPVCAGPDNEDADLRRVRDRETDDLPTGYRRALVADERNDSHFLIARITVTLKRFHNHALHYLASTPMDEWPNWSLGALEHVKLKNQTLFELARYVTTASWHNIIRNDLIPAFCSDPGADTAALDAKIASLPRDSYLAFGALRALHCLPLGVYDFAPGPQKHKLEDILGLRSDNIFLPEFTRWKMPWKNLFDIDGEGSALNRTAFDVGVTEQLKIDIGTDDPPLAHAIDYFRGVESDVFASKSFFQNFDAYLPPLLQRGQLRNTLGALFEFKGDVEGQLDQLIAWMPIPLLIQLEACLTVAGNGSPQLGQSRRLGRLGSRLLAHPLEVMLAEAEIINGYRSFGAVNHLICKDFASVLEVAEDVRPTVSF